MPLPTFEEAKRLYVDEQKNLAEICEMYGLTKASRTRVSRLLKAGGVEMRPQFGNAQMPQNGGTRKADADDEEYEPPKRGRPSGAKNKQKPAEKQTIGVAKKGDNAKVLKHNMAITEWEPVDMFSVKSVRERVNRYFKLCMSQDMSPTLPGLALAFGVSRFVFQRWVSGADVAPDVAAELYRAVCVIDADSAQKMVKGIVHPKSGEFLMKNTLGYRDETTVVQEHVEKRPSVEAIKAKYAKLLGE